MDKLLDTLKEIFDDTVDKIILSNRRKQDSEFQKIVIRQKEGKSGRFYQVEQFTNTQVFHKNLTLEEVTEFIADAISSSFKQFDAFTNLKNYTVKCKSIDNISVSKKSLKQPVSVNLSHNSEKSYLLKEGEIIPTLVDLGVITAEGKIMKSSYAKFKQINRSIEVI